MEMQQCGNCGASLNNSRKCEYCKSLIKDDTSNRLENMAFYGLPAYISSHAPSYYSTCMITHSYYPGMETGFARRL